LDDQRRHRAVLQQFDELVVRVEADELDFVGDLVFRDRLAGAL
jgi:hypothetical protein